MHLDLPSFWILSFSFSSEGIVNRMGHMIAVDGEKTNSKGILMISFSSLLFKSILINFYELSLYCLNYNYNEQNDYKMLLQSKDYRIISRININLKMISIVQNQNFIDEIVRMKAEDIVKLLKQEDQKLILSKKQQFVQKMPQVLRPNQQKQSHIEKSITERLYANLTHQKKFFNNNKHLFPSNQQMSVSPIKEYVTRINQNSIQSLTENVLKEKEEITEQILEKVAKNCEMPQKNIQELNEKQISFKNLQKQLGKNEEDKEEPSLRQSLNKSINMEEKNILNPFASFFLQPSKYSPFISNKSNFLDLHTNKKTTQTNYVSPQTYSMNMLQFSYNQKKQNTFDDRYSYPNVVMVNSQTACVKTAKQIRENPFKKTFVSKGDPQLQMNEERVSKNMETNSKFKQNVQNVLKYTLGDKRYTTKTGQKYHSDMKVQSSQVNFSNTEIKTKQPKSRDRILENPFVRRPASNYKY